MNEENFLVQFIPSKHCFLQFSNKWFQKLNNPKCSCLKLIHPTTKEELRFTWAPQPSFGLNDCSVGINATFAQSLNLHESDLVVLSSEEAVMSVRQVFLTPLSADDYEILEMSRDNVEVSLLNQIRVVYVNQIISVWVSKTMHLKLTVDRLEPILYHGRLEQMTELVIEDVTKTETQNLNNSHSSFNNSVANINNISNRSPLSKPSLKSIEPTFWNLLSSYVPTSVLNLLNPSEDTRTEQMPQVIDNTQLVCRVHPFPNVPEAAGCCEDAHDETIHPFNLFVHKRALQKDSNWPKNTFVPNFLQENNSVVVCRLEAVPVTKSKQQNSKNNENSKESESEQVVSVIVRLHKIDDSCRVFDKWTNVSCVYVPLFLRRLLDMNVGSKVKFTAYNPPIYTLLTDIKLFPSRNLSEIEADTVCQQFVARLPTRGGVLINNYCPFPIPQAEGNDGSVVLVQLSPNTLDCWPLTRSELQVCPVTVTTAGEKSLEEYFQKHLKGNELMENPLQLNSLFEKLVEEGVTTLEFGLRLVAAENQDMILDNILITGKQGSGKSRLAEAICAKVAGPPNYVHINVLDCKPLKGKKPESIGKIVAELLGDCIYHQPAVLVLDNLQCIAGAPTNDLEPSQETVYFLRLAVVLKELLWRVRLSQCVSVVATAESRGQIHPQLLAARGRHSFNTFLHIPALEMNHRLQIFKELLSAKIQSCSQLDLEDVVKKTEGCVAQDLCQLMDRVLFKACQRQTQADAGVQVTTEDFMSALQGFVPSGLLNVSLVRNTTHCFANVGGMEVVKKLLTEVLIWPTKYPAVFSQCPLRLERGALLYGAPGTGKTLLANAVAGESGLNLITVKGPELLSKYIGASEEAVRNVFQKAQSAQPCILFFDEFDSLAPRRGHDSTGVTDRVVNQLLTQMDGVEALDGVWVVAAASRPDLLDPALLRPGRIGSLIHCPLPDKAERLSILQSLSSKLKLSAEVDLNVVADRTNGFTGADLQAVLFTAQMTAYEALHQDSDEDLQITSSPIGQVAVNQNDLLVALETTTPSLKLEDRIKFQIIYERFQTSREGTSQVLPEESSQKVTLA